MNATDEDHVRDDVDNPFPSMPAAEVLHLNRPVVTIGTPAIAAATELLNGYLMFGRAGGPPAGGEPAGGPRRGAVVAITGEHGTGKTHLAMHLVRHARSLPSREAGAVYVDAQTGDFRSLYRNSFLSRFPREDVLRRVREYYAGIVADSLEGTGFPTTVTERLRDGELDPQRFVQQFGLMDSAFLQRLRADLRDVTLNEEFGTALMLLLRGDLGDQVWEWLRGETPDPLLQERGVTEPLDTDAKAIQAMGVFAMLYSGRDRRFVLVLDELEKVLSSAGRPPQAVIDEFRELLRVAGSAGIFLVLSGLPEFLNELGDNFNDRIGPIVRMDDFNSDDVTRYIETVMEQAGHGRTPGPFSRDVIGYMTAIAGGNARRIVQLCHACYSMAQQTGEVTAVMVRNATRGRFERVELPEVHAMTRKELDKGFRTYLTHHRVGGPDGPQVDFWIPIGTGAGGCALILTDSVLDERTAQKLADRSNAVRAASSGSRTLLVVNGYLVPRLRDRLATAFTERAVYHSAERFAEELDAALDTMIRRLESTELDDTTAIRAHVERMTMMQSSTQRFVESLADEVENLRALSDRRLEAIQRELYGLTPSDAARRTGEPHLPAPAERLFTETLAELEALAGADAALTSAADPDAPGSLNEVMSALSKDRTVGAVGAAALIRSLITTFRDAVRRWYAGLGPGPALRTPDRAEQARLRSLCHDYERAFVYLEVNRLEPLSRALARLQSQNRARPVSDPDNLETLLYDLGPQVRRLLLGDAEAAG